MAAILQLPLLVVHRKDLLQGDSSLLALEMAHDGIEIGHIVLRGNELDAVPFRNGNVLLSS